MADSESYIYILFDLTGCPFYVGQGRGNRWLDHERYCVPGHSKKDDLVHSVMTVMGEVPKVKIQEGLTNREALDFEYELIRAIGRFPAGPLVNRVSKGPGVHSEVTRKKISDARKRQVFSPESIAKRGASISRVLKGRTTGPQKAESIEKRRQSMIRAYAEGRRPRKTKNFGHNVQHSQDTIIRLRELGKMRSKEMSEVGRMNANTCWITDGKNNKKLRDTESLPAGFKFGRTYSRG
jgi:hypothetical protein